MKENKEVMSRNITRLMNEKGIIAADICRDLDIKANTFSDWIHAKTYPRIDKIELMSRYFGVNKSELVEENYREFKADIPVVKPEYIELVDKYSKLSASQQKIILDTINAFLVDSN